MAFPCRKMSGIRISYRKEKNTSVYMKILSIGIVELFVMLFWDNLFGCLKLESEWMHLGKVVIPSVFLGCLFVMNGSYLGKRIPHFEVGKRIAIIIVIAGIFWRGRHFFLDGIYFLRDAVELVFDLTDAYETWKVGFNTVPTEVYWIVAMGSIALAMLVQFLLMKRTGLLFLLILPFLPMALVLGCNHFPDERYLGISIFSVLMLVICYQGGKTKHIVRNEVLVLILMIGMGSLSTTGAGKITIYREHHQKQYWSVRSTIKKIEKMDFESLLHPDGGKNGNFATQGIGKGNLKGLAHNHPSKKKEWILTVSDQKPKNTLYLKSFAASRYTKDAWKIMDDDSKEEFHELFPDAESIENLNSSVYYKMLYTFGDYDLKGENRYKFEVGGRMKNTFCLSLDIVRMDHNEIPGLQPYLSDYYGEVNEELVSDYDEHFYYSYMCFPNSVLEFLTKDKIKDVVYKSKNFSDEREHTISGEKIQKKFDDAVKNYDFSEQWKAYCSFVNNHYLDYPEDSPELQKLINTLKTREKQPDYEGVENEINKIFEKGFSYDLNPGKKSDGEDFIEDFLKKEKGFCVHYATTATMLYRAMGIPARYVEGFAVPRNQFKKVDDVDLSLSSPFSVQNVENPSGEDYTPSRKEDFFTTYITDEMAHAWVEVFDENVGWIPREHTIGTSYPISQDFAPVKKQEPVTTQKKKKVQQTTKKQETTKKKEIVTKVQKDQPTAVSNQEEDNQKYLPWIMMGLGIVVIAVGMLFLYFVRVEHKEIRFSKRKNNLGIRYMIQELYLLGRICGIKFSSESEKEIFLQLKEEGLGLQQEDWEWIYETGLSAAFSARMISTEEIRQMKKYIRKCRKDVLRKTHPLKRWWIRIKYAV